MNEMGWAQGEAVGSFNCRLSQAEERIGTLKYKSIEINQSQD